MVDRDRNDTELQIAAVVLSERLGAGKQRQVADELKRIYPTRGAFDNVRVSRLCRHAIGDKLAIAPSTAKLVRNRLTEKWEKAFYDAERRVLHGDPVRTALVQYCSENDVVAPTVVVASGNVNRPRAQATSEYAANAAEVALKYLKDWIADNPQARPMLGVTWGRQLHYAAVAATNDPLDRYLRGARLSVVPLVGLPIGGPRSDIMSSSEIARSLAYRVSPNRGDEYDLQLVPAYLPESEFSEKQLPALYKLLGLMEGWSRVFGTRHMTHPTDGVPATKIPEVYNCNFIWSSVSDMDEPFGFPLARQPSLLPFSQRSKRNNETSPRPVADCGGIPLWADVSPARVAQREASFARRWTGIRRDQWRHCVQHGNRAMTKDNAVCGAVLFAPTAEKAQPVLYAVRDGLANLLILGRPCADRMLEILQESRARP